MIGTKNMINYSVERISQQILYFKVMEFPQSSFFFFMLKLIRIFFSFCFFLKDENFPVHRNPCETFIVFSK